MKVPHDYTSNRSRLEPRILHSCDSMVNENNFSSDKETSMNDSLEPFVGNSKINPNSTGYHFSSTDNGYIPAILHSCDRCINQWNNLLKTIIQVNSSTDNGFIPAILHICDRCKSHFHEYRKISQARNEIFLFPHTHCPVISYAGSWSNENHLP